MTYSELIYELRGQLVRELEDTDHSLTPQQIDAIEIYMLRAVVDCLQKNINQNGH